MGSATLPNDLLQRKIVNAFMPFASCLMLLKLHNDIVSFERLLMQLKAVDAVMPLLNDHLSPSYLI